MTHRTGLLADSFMPLATLKDVQALDSTRLEMVDKLNQALI